MASKFDKIINAHGASTEKSKGDEGIAVTAQPEPKKVRPQGKRSNPNYTQVSAYIPKDLHRQVKVELVSSDQDFSELVSQLLEEWLNDA